MRNVLLAFALLSGLLSPLAASELAIRKGEVVVIPLKGEISDAQFFFLRRVLKVAESESAGGIIINMDTPGGKMDSALEILNLLRKSTIPVFTYVNDDAGSAGALIALGTKSIYMAPVSAIGAAAPVMEGGKDIPETMNDKVVSYYSGYFRSAAEKNGYNPDIAQAFIDKNSEVKIGNTVVSPKGKLLTLSAQEAVRKYNGKPLLAIGIADSVEDVAKQAGLSGTLVAVTPSGFEKIALFLTALAPLLLMGGIIGAYVEMKTAGFGVAGAFSITCFVLFFAGHYIAGLTGFETVVIFLIGVVLILVEVIFFPGHLVSALTGILLIIGALLFAMVDRFPGQPVIPSLHMLKMPMINMTIALVLSLILIAILARYFPDIPLLNRLVLKTQEDFGSAQQSSSISDDTFVLSSGAEGTAMTILRPAGKADFHGRLVDVITEGGFIENGVRIRVVEAGKDRIVVRPA